jgi:hypothetical protein
MSMPRILLGAAMVAALSMSLVGQQAPVGIHHIQCVKVSPGQQAAVQEWIDGDSHKLTQSLVDSGAYAMSLVLRTQMPAGTDAQCDYVFVTFYNGLPPAPRTRDEMNQALRKADIQMTAGAYNAKLSEMGKLVWDNITQYQALVGGAKKGDYLEFNSMSSPDPDACVAIEKKDWQPLAEQMVKDGNTDGWAINRQVFPRGTRDEPAVSTVDVFPSWDAFTHHYDSIRSAWPKVHGDADFASTMAQHGKLCTIEHTVLYKVVDAVTPSK